MNKSTSYRLRYGARTCMLVLLALLCLGYLFLRGLGAYLIHGDAVKQSDAVAVLGGGGDHRVVEAVRLIDEEMGRVLILTDTGAVGEGENVWQTSNAFRIVAIENGLSPGAIMLTEQVVESTYDEARAVRQTMEQHGMKSVIVVTDPFHTERTRRIFRDAFLGSDLSIRVRPVPGHWYRSGTWFLSREGWGHTIREYAKLAGYLLGLSSTLE